MKTKWVLVIAAVMLFATSPRLFAAPQVSGIVVSDRGKPISDVRIVWGERKNDETNTDSKGIFEFPQIHGQLLHILKDGFRPQTIVVAADTTQLKIVLVQERNAGWTIPKCAGSGTHDLVMPFLPKFVIPVEAKEEKFSDVDYGKTSIKFSKASVPLELWWGLVAAPDDRERFLLSKSIEFKLRLVRSSMGSLGTDIRGQTMDGKFWRYVRFRAGFAVYEDASEEVKRLYDTVINSACLPN